MDITDPAFHLISPASPIYQVMSAPDGVTVTVEVAPTPPTPMSTEDRLFFEWMVLGLGLLFVAVCLVLHYTSKNENY